MPDETTRAVRYSSERRKDEDIQANHAEAAEICSEHERGTHHLYMSGMQASLSPSRIHRQALAGVSCALTPTTSLVPGGSTIAECIVAVDHLTDDAVQAEDEVTAIDLVLEEQGLEISSETRDASMTEYERREPRRHTSPEGGPSHSQVMPSRHDSHACCA
jgi:hypothetical protein